MRIFSDLNDHQCAALAQKGNGKAFSEIVARYQDRIYRFMVRLTRSPETALDLTQDIFLRVYQGLERWHPDAQFKTWLFRIARTLPSTICGAINGWFLSSWKMILRCRQTQPLEHRKILLLREIEEMTYDEIALVLQLNLGTVKSRIARARAALLAHIER